MTELNYDSIQVGMYLKFQPISEWNKTHHNLIVQVIDFDEREDEESRRWKMAVEYVHVFCKCCSNKKVKRKDYIFDDQVEFMELVTELPKVKTTHLPDFL